MNHTELMARAPHVPEKPKGRRLAERGLTTVEYAIGLVAAATAALMLLRVFQNSAFLEALTAWVLKLFQGLVGDLS